MLSGRIVYDARDVHVLMAEATNYRGAIRVGSHAYAAAFLDAGFEVMWVGSPLGPHSLFRQDDETVRRVAIWKRRGAFADDGALEYYPMTVLPATNQPLLRTRFVVANTLRFSIPRIDTVLRARGFGHPDLLWLSQSRISAALARMVPSTRTVYRVSDDWARFPGVPASLVRAERDVVARADAVFASAHALVDAYRDLNANITYLPNGVSRRFFERAEEPACISGFARPRVVYVGSLAWWLDADTIASTARCCPDARIVLLGPGQPPRGMPENVVAPGPVSWTDIPGILQHSDVAIIPFAQSALTHAVSPVKLFEYLASGIPIVSTRLGEIEAAGTPARLGRSPAEFSDAVRRLLDGSDVWDRDSAVACARQHTWEKRFAIVRETLGL